MFGRNDFLGEVTINLQGIVFDNPQPQWYTLQERVSIRMFVKPKSASAEQPNDLHFKSHSTRKYPFRESLPHPPPTLAFPAIPLFEAFTSKVAVGHSVA